MKIIAANYNYTNYSRRESFKGGSPPKAMQVGMDFLQNLKNLQTFKMVIENASLETLKSLISNPAIGEQKRAIALEQLSKLGETLKKTSKTKKPSKTNAENLLDSINRDMAKLKKKIEQLAALVGEGKGKGLKTEEHVAVSGLSDDINRFKTSVLEKSGMKQKNFETYKKYLENKDCDNVLALHILENASKVDKKDVDGLVGALIDYAARTKDDGILIPLEKFCSTRRNKTYGVDIPLIQESAISKIRETAFKIGDLNYMTGEKLCFMSSEKILHLSNFALEKNNLNWFSSNMRNIQMPGSSEASQKCFLNYLELFERKIKEGETPNLFDLENCFNQIRNMQMSGWSWASEEYEQNCFNRVKRFLANAPYDSNNRSLKRIKEIGGF